MLVGDTLSRQTIGQVFAFQKIKPQVKHIEKFGYEEAFFTFLHISTIP